MILIELFSTEEILSLLFKLSGLIGKNVSPVFCPCADECSFGKLSFECSEVHIVKTIKNVID